MGDRPGRLEGKVAIVTGSARGTGEEIVRLFAAEGARVLAVDLLEERGRAVVDDIGRPDDVAFTTADVTDADAWARVAAEAHDRWGGLHVLVNNAAILHLAPVEWTTPEMFERVFKVNCYGAFLGIQSCVPYMVRGGGGSIVNIGSTDSISGVPSTVAYTSSKFAMRGLTKVVALEYGQHNVRCNIVCPGAGNPEMIQELFASGSARFDPARAGSTEATMPLSTRPLARRGTPADVAPAALYFASDESSFATGTELVVDGGQHAGMYVDVPGQFLRPTV
jgi:3alpha(or 20beta)-hydroxysteroid dehydrogenase